MSIGGLAIIVFIAAFGAVMTLVGAVSALEHKDASMFWVALLGCAFCIAYVVMAIVSYLDDRIVEIHKITVQEDK